MGTLHAEKGQLFLTPYWPYSWMPAPWTIC